MIQHIKVYPSLETAKRKFFYAHFNQNGSGRVACEIKINTKNTPRKEETRTSWKPFLSWDIFATA